MERPKHGSVEGIKEPLPLEQAIADKFGLSLEQVPKIDLHYVFLRHATAEDAKVLQEPIEKADVVLTEWHGGGNSDAAEEFLKEITHGLGLFVAYHNFNTWDDPESFLFTFYSMLEGTHKIAVPLDIPSEHKAYQGINDSLETYSKFGDKLMSSGPPSFFDALEEFADIGKRFATFQASRDEYIGQQTIPAMLRALEKKPELLKKEDVSILAWFGSFHTGVYHDAKRDIHGHATRSFPLSPYLFGSDVFGEVARSYRFGKVPAREVIARAFLLYILQHVFEKQFKSLEMHKNDSKTRKLLSTFSVDEIEKIYDLKFFKKDDEAVSQVIQTKLDTYPLEFSAQ